MLEHELKESHSFSSAEGSEKDRFALFNDYSMLWAQGNLCDSKGQEDCTPKTSVPVQTPFCGECLSKFTQTEKTIAYFRSLSTFQHRAVICGLLSSLNLSKDLNEPAESHQLPFRLYRRSICQDAFLYLTDTTPSILESIQSEFIQDFFIPCPQITGKAYHLIEVLQPEQAVQRFLQYIASIYGYPCRTGLHNGISVQYLPPYMTFDHVYQRFSKAMTRLGENMSAQTFRMLWKTSSHDVQLLDFSVCQVCRTLRRDDSEQSQSELAHHEFKAVNEREHYQRIVLQTRISGDNEYHLSFGFSNIYRLPHFLGNLQDTVAMKNGLQVEFFGVSNDTTEQQRNYPLVEGCFPAGFNRRNLVLSILHHHLQSLPGVKVLHFTTDNDRTEKRHRWMLFYCLWRVIMGYNEQVNLYYMVPGHSATTCDYSLNQLGQEFRSRNVETPSDLPNAESAAEIQWFEWDLFLDQFFVSIPPFHQMHAFHARQSKPSGVHYKSYSNAREWSFTRLIKQTVPNFDAIRDPVHPLSTYQRYPTGICPKRKQYLDTHLLIHLRRDQQESFFGSRRHVNGGASPEQYT